MLSLNLASSSADALPHSCRLDGLPYCSSKHLIISAFAASDIGDVAAWSAYIFMDNLLNSYIFTRIISLLLCFVKHIFTFFLTDKPLCLIIFYSAAFLLFSNEL